MKNNLYRNIYNIAVYSDIKDEETLLALCDNVKEFAEFLKTSINSASTILKKLWDKKSSYIVVNHAICTVEFIKL